MGGHATLNLGLHNGDDEGAVRENFARFCAAAGFEVDAVVFSNQVHGIDVAEVVVPLGNMRRLDTPADGLMTGNAQVALATYYADCVPLLFFDPIKGVVANSHAGWRGVVGNMAGQTVKAMQSRFASGPKDILVGIGPSICTACFQVDKDVAKNFQKNLSFSSKFVYNSESNTSKYHIDLWGICRESLVLAGIVHENIEIAGICTCCNPDLFFSHRRTNVPRGNMLAVIGRAS